MAGDDQTPRLRLYWDDAAAVDDLFRQAVRAQGEGALPEFLNFLARFRRYSLFNAMLIRVQRPGAMAVASRRRWQEEGRMVAGDAVPIIILQPLGQCSLSTKSATPMAHHCRAGWSGGRSMQQETSAEANGKKRSPAGRSAALRSSSLIIMAPAWLERPQCSIGPKTRFLSGAPMTRGSGSGSIAVSTLGRFATLAHELGHIYCGHLGGDSRSRWADRSGELELGQRELEAEAVSWLICRRLGLETRSAEYLACYVKDGDLERISAFVITAAAHRIEAWRQA